MEQSIAQRVNQPPDNVIGTRTSKTILLDVPCTPSKSVCHDAGVKFRKVSLVSWVTVQFRSSRSSLVFCAPSSQAIGKGLGIPQKILGFLSLLSILSVFTWCIWQFPYWVHTYWQSYICLVTWHFCHLKIGPFIYGVISVLNFALSKIEHCIIYFPHSFNFNKCACLLRVCPLWLQCK